MPNKFTSRFAELTTEAEGLAKVAALVKYDTSPTKHLENAVLKWTLKAKHLVGLACGQDSLHLQEFDYADKAHRGFGLEYRLGVLSAVFSAARDDFEGGYFTTVRGLIQAEVFASETEQAAELLRKGYTVAAAVIAGTVLETALRELCDRNQIPRAMIGKMNEDLARKGVYNALTQKRVLSLAQVRNDAAHGNHGQFTEADVKGMISDIERLVADHLS